MNADAHLEDLGEFLRARRAAEPSYSRLLRLDDDQRVDFTNLPVSAQNDRAGLRHIAIPKFRGSSCRHLLPLM